MNKVVYTLTIDYLGDNQLIIRGDVGEFVLLESEWREHELGRLIGMLDDTFCHAWAVGNNAFSDALVKARQT